MTVTVTPSATMCSKITENKFLCFVAQKRSPPVGNSKFTRAFPVHNETFIFLPRHFTFLKYYFCPKNNQERFENHNSALFYDPSLLSRAISGGLTYFTDFHSQAAIVIALGGVKFYSICDERRKKTMLYHCVVIPVSGKFLENKKIMFINFVEMLAQANYKTILWLLVMNKT